MIAGGAVCGEKNAVHFSPGFFSPHVVIIIFAKAN